MNAKINWTRILYIIGVIAVVMGTLDPLEGSVAIAAGAGFIALSTYLSQDRHWKIFLGSWMLILFGVGFIFYFSSLGGFGGTSRLSWWWGTLILPYPIGWLISFVLLLVRLKKTNRN